MFTGYIGVCKWFLPKSLEKNGKDKKQNKTNKQEKEKWKVVPKLFWRQIVESKLKYVLTQSDHPPLNAFYDAGTVRQQKQRA